MNWVAPIRDEDTLNLFKEKLLEHDVKYYIMFELGIGTGMQLKDILSLKVKDVKGKESITVEIGTKHIETTFNVPEALQKTIDEFVEGKDSEEYLVRGHDPYAKLSREQAFRVIKAVGRSIGVSSIGAQTMRKTFAYNYYKETGDIYYLQNLLNHASPSITFRYIGEKPNVDVVLHKMTAEENERSRYMLYLNGSGKARLEEIIKTLTDIYDNFDNPLNNDAFYGKVDCLLEELEVIMKTYKGTK